MATNFGTTNGGDIGRSTDQRRIVVETEDQWPHAFAQLKMHMGQTNVLGFDCEWVEINNWRRYEENGYSDRSNNDPLEEIRLRNGRQERVSLMQMATYDGLIVLVRLIYFQTTPTSMKEFLADGSILKIGVNIFEDCSRLYKDWGLLVNGWLDLRNICLEIPNVDIETVNNGDQNVLKNGLKALGARFCENTVPYDQRMRYSNWCMRKLTESQLHYASQDAIIAVKVLAKLGKDYLHMKRVDNDDETRFWSDMNTYVRPYLNRKHDAERQQQKKSAHDASSKRKIKKEEVEDSSSDVDMDWNTLNETCSNRDAVLFLPKPYMENGRIVRNNNVVAAVSPHLLSLCGRVSDGKTPPVRFKVDSGGKRYIFKMSLKKIDSKTPL